MALNISHLLAMAGIGALITAVPAVRSIIEMPAEASGADGAARTALLLPETGIADQKGADCCLFSRLEKAEPPAGEPGWGGATLQMAQGTNFGAYPPIGYDPEAERKLPPPPPVEGTDGGSGFLSAGGNVPLQAPGYIPMGAAAPAAMPSGPATAMPTGPGVLPGGGVPPMAGVPMGGMAGMGGDGAQGWGAGPGWPLPRTGAEPISVNDDDGLTHQDWASAGWGSPGEGSPVGSYPGQPAYSNFPPEGGTLDSHGGTARQGQWPYGAPRVDGYGGYGARPPVPPVGYGAAAPGWPGAPVGPGAYGAPFGTMPGYGYGAPYPPPPPGYPYAMPGYQQQRASEPAKASSGAPAVSPWGSGAMPALPGGVPAAADWSGTSVRVKPNGDRNLPYSTGNGGGNGFPPPGGFEPTPEKGPATGGGRQGSIAVKGIGVAVYPPSDGSVPTSGKTLRVDFGNTPEARTAVDPTMTASVPTFPYGPAVSMAAGR